MPARVSAAGAEPTRRPLLGTLSRPLLSLGADAACPVPLLRGGCLLSRLHLHPAPTAARLEAVCHKNMCSYFI